jgi:hypothetical protein
VCHFANATELDRIKSKGPILFDLIRSNSVRFSLGSNTNIYPNSEAPDAIPRPLYRPPSSKGAPARKSRTGTRLVSPASRREKKYWTPPEQGLRMQN